MGSTCRLKNVNNDKRIKFSQYESALIVLSDALFYKFNLTLYKQLSH